MGYISLLEFVFDVYGADSRGGDREEFGGCVEVGESYAGCEEWEL